MSRIDDLIAELCPDGVAFEELGNCAAYSDTRIDAVELDETNFIGVDNLLQNAGGKTDANYPPNTARLTAYQIGDILLGNIRPYLKKIWLASDDGGCSGDVLAIRIRETHRTALMPEFLYRLLASDIFFAYNMQHAKGAKMPRGSKEAILKYRIPLPPAKIQREIVKILDAFTELEAELVAELEARQKQYQYYRDELLSFDGREDVRWVTLGNFCGIYDGTHQTPKYTDSGVRFVSVENIKALGQSEKFISEEEFAKNYKIKPVKNDVFMTRIGSIGTCAVIENDEPLAYYVTLTLLRPNASIMLSNYLKYIIESGVGVRELRKRTLVNATPIKINLGEIGKIVLPVPSLDEQTRIVEILDKFDALVNDISIGLPAEIAARRQQYAYYRDKLLSFKEAA